MLSLIACIASCVLSSPPSSSGVIRERLEAHAIAGHAIEVTPEVRGALDTIDANAHQRDALWSGLTWHTNLDAARSEARRLNRPILSLRMLGRLDDEFSCANSRFFRAALYANAEISSYLRDNYVLHWQSVRPAPRITIDFGDGRTIESTIAGNSIHYVLTPEGVVADALPGLYGPGVFLDALKTAHTAALSGEFTPEAAVAAQESGVLVPAAQGRFEQVPEDMARAAMRTAMSKAFVEMPMLDAVLGLDDAPVPTRVPYDASGYIHRCRLDNRSISLIRTQMNDADDSAVSVAIARFELSMAQDTAQNEESIRPRILAIIEQDPSLRTDLDRLNERVYAEVFRTPSTDAWLGLHDPQAFTGIWSGSAHGQDPTLAAR